MVALPFLWGSYFMSTLLLEDPEARLTTPGWLFSLFQHMFWPTMILSFIAFFIASLKSVLPGLIALVAVIPLVVLDLTNAAKLSVVLSSVGVFAYWIGFGFHGGNLNMGADPGSARD